MARWEYKIIFLGPNVNGFPRPADRRLFLEEEQILNGLGQADWELVTINHGLAYMKRRWTF